MAYRLRLPEGSRIHNVFHVSLLRPFVEGGVEKGAGLPSDFCGDRPLVYPVRVLDRRTLWHDREPKEHVLVRWSDGSDSPSWEPLEVVRRRFPNVLLEDKEVAMEGGVDTLPLPQDQPVAVDQQPEAGRTEEVEVRPDPQPSIAKSKAKRQLRQPVRFGDYTPK